MRPRNTPARPAPHAPADPARHQQQQERIHGRHLWRALLRELCSRRCARGAGGRAAQGRRGRARGGAHGQGMRPPAACSPYPWRMRARMRCAHQQLRHAAGARRWGGPGRGAHMRPTQPRVAACLRAQQHTACTGGSTPCPACIALRPHLPPSPAALTRAGPRGSPPAAPLPPRACSPRSGARRCLTWPLS